MSTLRPGRSLVVLLVVVGTVGPAVTLAGTQASPLRTVDADDGIHHEGRDAGASPPPDPETDVVGWEDGYWYNESIDVNQSDGLDKSERDAFLSRTMARVEYLRGLEFRSRPALEFIDRETLAERRERTFGFPTDEQLWEAMFVLGEDTNATRAVGERFGGSVVGYAAEEGADHIVIVNRDPSEPKVGAIVLAHELVHVLQDQHFDLSAPRYDRDTFDGVFAKDGLVEGEASYVHRLYAEQCDADWECVPSPEPGWAGATRKGTWRFHRLTLQPYSDGAHYVAQLREGGGWAAVDATHRDPPESSAAIVHPGRNATPEPMTFVDRSNGDWTTVGRPQTVGEVGLYTLLWRSLNDQGQVDRDGPEVDGPYDTFDYNDPITAGWANDRLVTYAAGDRRGYVWAIRWETVEDAETFADAYRRQLQAEGANRTGKTTWVLPEGPFADAFRVERTGRTVVVVNGPTESSLRAIRPPERTPSSSPSTTAGPSATAGPSTSTGPPAMTSPSTGTSVPGFGIASALGGLILAALALRSRLRR